MPKKASSKEKQGEAEEAAELVRYELGYHLVPLVHEDSLPAEVGQIREVIEQAGGISTADQFPAARPLSYGMSRMVGGKRETFTQSYFGWMQFELPAGAIEEVKHSLGMNDHILRLIIVRTKREIPIVTRTTSIVQPAEEVPMGDAEPVVARTTEPLEPTLSDEELDKTIEELVID